MADMNLNVKINIFPYFLLFDRSFDIQFNMFLFLVVAERIAAERGESVGDTVGYQVSLD